MLYPLQNVLTGTCWKDLSNEVESGYLGWDPWQYGSFNIFFFYSRQESLYMTLIVSGFLQWQFDIAVICTCIDIIIQYKNVLSLIFSGFSLYPQTVLYEGIHIWRLEDIIRFVVCL